MDMNLARTNMVKCQFRTWDVQDERVLSALESTPREAFVPSQYEKLAFVDTNIELGHGQVMMTPKEEARMLQALDIQANEKVLEIGTGSGYVTAVLAKLADQIYSVEIIPELYQEALQKLQTRGENIHCEQGDAAHGWSQHAPYDVIAVTGSFVTLPETMKGQVNVGGRIFAIVGEAPAMTATLWTRKTVKTWQEQTLFETVIPPLQNITLPEQFKF